MTQDRIQFAEGSDRIIEAGTSYHLDHDIVEHEALDLTNDESITMNFCKTCDRNLETFEK